MDLLARPLAEVAAAVRSRRLSARELVEAALDAVDRDDPAIHAFVAVDGERALAEAAAVDARVARGEEVGPLAGVPLGVKDTEDAVGYRTTYGSRLWEDAPVATGDSVLVGRLRAAGCIVLGKTNTPELASKATTDNRLFPPTRSPISPDHTAGGSSGGSAAAVASAMVGLGTGSDGGGSIRIPSACCGLTGFKPSLGRVPDGGAVPPDWHDLTTRGVLARRAADLVLAYETIVGPHPTDLRSLPAPSVPWTAAVAAAPRPLRVAWSPTLGYAPTVSEVQSVCEAAVARLEAAGVEVVVRDAVFEADPAVGWLQLVAAYNERTLAPFAARLESEPDLLDPTVAAYRAFGREVTAIDLVAAEDAAHRLNLRLVALFEEVDLLLSPTLCGLPPRVDDTGDPSWVGCTYPFNLTRSPAGTVPVGSSADGRPIALQIVGPQHGDVAVLRALGFVEEVVAG